MTAALTKRIDDLAIALHLLEKQQEAQHRCILRLDSENIALKDRLHRLETRGCDE